MLPKSILFPVDFCDRCRATAPAVADFAASLKLPVKLLHSIDFGQSDLDATALSAEFDTIRCHFENKLRQFALPQLPHALRETAMGPAAASILHWAQNMESPLIMMPTRGRTRFRRLLLGSVTAAVLHDAPGPVWTSAHAPEHNPKGVPGRGVLCAIELGPRTRRVMETAREFAVHFAVPCSFVHSVPAVDPQFHSAPAARAHRLARELAKEAFLKLSAKTGLKADLEIREELTLTAGILQSLREHSCDLLVIGRGSTKGPLGRLRSSAYDLIRQSPCPVLSL